MESFAKRKKRSASLYPSLVAGLGGAVIAFCCGFVFGVPLCGDPDSLWLGLAAGGAAGAAVFSACLWAARKGLWDGLGY